MIILKIIAIVIASVLLAFAALVVFVGLARQAYDADGTQREDFDSHGHE